MKAKLLAIELWGLGDLTMAAPFLRAASEHYDVTLIAKPFAREIAPRFFPKVKIVPFVAPWTAFRKKYRLATWPWATIWRTLRHIRAESFDVGLSARWDPRDHVMLKLTGARERLGFSRDGSGVFLSRPINRPLPGAHRYEYWRLLGQSLGVALPDREGLQAVAVPVSGKILVHTGAGQSIRVWPLERYRNVIRRLRDAGWLVQVACDPSQRQWWLNAGESGVATPNSVSELFALIDQAGLFIGNDSGPGHLAAGCGVPTLTIFGPQLSEWFAPLHPHAEWIDGKACPYKPCFDYCRYDAPQCLLNVSEDEAWRRVQSFASRRLPASTGETALRDR